MTTSPPPIDLQELLGDMSSELYNIEADNPSPPLIAARLADQMRDLQLQPTPPEDFEILTMDLDTEGWRRLSLLVETILQSEAIEAHIAAIQGITAARLLEEHLVQHAHNKSLLPIELMNLSEIRLEEFCRGWLDSLCIPIAGETPDQSAQRLQELDYERLLGEADRAKEAAEERLAELRRLQEEQEAAHRRSKW